MRNHYARNEYTEARRFVLKYRCSVCWGPLVERIDGDGSYVECVKPDDECDKTGFVTLAYVHRRQSEDMVDASEARHNLPFLKPEKRAAEDLINEITGG